MTFKQDLGDGRWSLSILMELADTDLEKFLVKKQNKKLSVAEIDTITCQLLSGLKYMHADLNIKHLDLHMGNVLIKYGSQSELQQILITDFGKAAEFSNTVIDEKVSTTKNLSFVVNKSFNL